MYDLLQIDFLRAQGYWRYSYRWTWDFCCTAITWTNWADKEHLYNHRVERKNWRSAANRCFAVLMNILQDQRTKWIQSPFQKIWKASFGGFQTSWVISLPVFFQTVFIPLARLYCIYIIQSCRSVRHCGFCNFVGHITIVVLFS